MSNGLCWTAEKIVNLWHGLYSDYHDCTVNLIKINKMNPIRFDFLKSPLDHTNTEVLCLKLESYD